ncbi:MAG TPA: DJ-1/PfpI family protein [Dehalococcoidia bacterium]|nr:DJ-1/PfpI family protein [Dehalococcoidia bacterium]
MTFNIALILFPNFEELDFVGPFEVFGMAAKLIDNDWHAYSVAATPEVRAFHGLRVLADYTFENAPQPDLICVPGGFGTRPGMKDAALVDYIRRAGTAATHVTSVCTGALLLHSAGFLEGRRATTHWAAIPELRALGGGTEVVEEARWVVDGNVITSAGVSAGIDMALYVVGQLKSPADARKVQHRMEYYPAPPYAESP